MRVASQKRQCQKRKACVGFPDEDYRGTVNVILFNMGHEPFVGTLSQGGFVLVQLDSRFSDPSCLCFVFYGVSVNPGDRIAQLILEKISTPEVVEVDSLEGTERGTAGFGSTGLSAV